MAEINEASELHLRAKVVGEGVKRGIKETEPFTNDYKRITDYKRIIDLVVYCKAVRRVGGYLGLDVGDREIRALAMVWAWCWQFNKEGGPRSKIVDWSGYSKGWRQRMQSGIENCLNQGLLELKRVRNGTILKITAKGETVMNGLEVKSDIVIEEMEGKREKPKRVKL